MRLILRLGVVVLAAALVGCSGGNTSAPSTTTGTAGGRPSSALPTFTSGTSAPSATASSATDAQVAAAAERLVRENRLEGPDYDKPFEGPFLSFKCSDWMLENEPEGCWEPWLNGFSFGNGTLQVTLQVDRTDPFSILQAKDAALWFRNFISADKGILRANVHQIVVTDGTGTEMARQSALTR